MSAPRFELFSRLEDAQTVETAIAAVQGDANAQNIFGIRNGNPAEKPAWLNAAASKDNVHAITNLGWYYETQENYTAARQFYQKAVALGGATAAYNLGFLHEAGMGVKKDYGLARLFYKLAIDRKNNVKALIRLAHLNERGLGGPTDFIAAEKFYIDALKQESLIARENLINLYNMQGKNLEMRREYSQAKKMYEKAAAFDNEFAFFRLGALYMSGFGVVRNFDTSKEYFERAQEKGYALASEALRALSVFRARESARK